MKIQEAFAENFRNFGEVGGAVSVVIDGEAVVDLWAGWCDEGRTLPWEWDTLVCVQSVSKEVMALALHMAVDRGLVDLDAPVARYWPEFAQAGKETAKVRWLLDHRMGLPVVENAWHGMAYDWSAMVEGLAATKPLWEPGTTPCYHSATYGFPVGEVLRRVTGRSPGTFLREEICGPLGIEFYFGLQEDENSRVATFLHAAGHPSRKWVEEGDNIFARSWKIFWQDEDFNSEAWRRAEVPSVNGHTNARSLARLCGALACGGSLDGVRLLRSETLERAAEIQWTGPDVQGRFLSLSLGFLMPTAFFPSTGPRSLGMAGAGGATAFADPDHRLGFGYVMNSMDPTTVLPPRPTRLIEALKACLAA